MWCWESSVARWLRWVIQMGTILAWLLLLGDLVVPVNVFHLKEELGRLLIGVAMLGSMTSVVAFFQRPCEEIFDAGREYQRRVDVREQIRERTRRATITPIRRKQLAYAPIALTPRIAANDSSASSDTSVSELP